MTFLEQCCHGLVLELAELGIEASVQKANFDPYVDFSPYCPVVEFRTHAICFWENGDMDSYIAESLYFEFEYADPNSIPQLIATIRKVLGV